MDLPIIALLSPPQLATTANVGFDTDDWLLPPQEVA